MNRPSTIDARAFCCSIQGLETAPVMSTLRHCRDFGSDPHGQHNLKALPNLLFLAGERRGWLQSQEARMDIIAY
jgi:hypothetical protein